MKERFKLAIALLAGLAFAAAALLLLIFFWGRYYPLPYSLLTPVIQPAGTPADLGELTARVKNIEDNQAYNLKVFEWKLDQKLLILGWVALFISFLAGFMGLKTYNDLEKVIKERVNTVLEKEIYQLDPTNLPIRLVKHETMTGQTEAIWKRLELTGLKNIEKIDHLDKSSKRGVTILLIDGKEEENKFAGFLKAHKIIERKTSKERYLDPQKAAFIAYTQPSKWLDDKTLSEYENLATANMAATVASMILVVGRGLKNRED